MSPLLFRYLTLPALVLASSGCAAMLDSRTNARLAGPSLRAHVEFLASDALNGRGSGTRDEQIAAEYVGTHFRRLGLAPADSSGSFVQTIDLERSTMLGMPRLVGAGVRWTHGDEILVPFMNVPAMSGPLQHLAGAGAAQDVRRGAMVFVPAPLSPDEASRVFAAGASAILAPASAQARERWSVTGKSAPTLETRLLAFTSLPEPRARITLAEASATTISKMAEGTVLRLETDPGPPVRSQTWNAVGILHGTQPDTGAVLVSAHLDHLGRRSSEAGAADTVFNGADDNASGTAAVMELAEKIARHGRLKRTVVFAAFGSEEAGATGSKFFVARPVVPLTSIVANLHIEMLGRPDALVPPQTLWLTGYDRSDLGPELARRGAKIVADPRPSQNFFQRSDNYTLALRGVVAHTVSSFGLHKEYHTTADEPSLIDWTHMETAVGSLVKPLMWLANSEFVPAWRPGGRP
jgi:aminopeptidase YwaD